MDRESGEYSRQVAGHYQEVVRYSAVHMELEVLPVEALAAAAVAAVDFEVVAVAADLGLDTLFINLMFS